VSKLVKRTSLSKSNLHVYEIVRFAVQRVVVFAENETKALAKAKTFHGPVEWAVRSASKGKRILKRLDFPDEGVV
jgi:hypothetical protein